MIEQPTRRTVGRPLRFHAICPACGKLLECDNGIWPEHRWDNVYSEMQCYMSMKPHDTMETKR